VLPVSHACFRNSEMNSKTKSSCTLACLAMLALPVLSRATPKLQITTTSLPTATVSTVYSCALKETGGRSPYTWFVRSGNIPNGLTLSSTGLISGAPTSAGLATFTVQVDDSTGRNAARSLTLSVGSPVQISTSTLPKGTVNTAYSAILQGTGGATPYSWSVTAGQLPQGLTFASSSGMISGTPLASGTYNVTIKMADAGGQSTSGIFSILVAAVVCSSCSGNLTITTSPLPGGSVGVPYSAALTGTGGTPPYTWSMTGQLPIGFTLGSSGIISGTPTVGGSYGFGLTLADSGGSSVSQTYSIAVSNSTLAMLTNDVHLGYINQPYDAVLTAGAGTAPYSWMISSGQLPVGISLNSATGHISGTPTEGGQFSITVGVQDATHATTSKSFSLQVFEQPTDQYGGLVNLPCPNGPQPHFYTQKTGSRWHLCTPAGNAFFMLGVSNVDSGDTSIADLGVSYRQSVTKKYGNPDYAWANQTIKRLLSWGFNTAVEEQSTYIWPFGRPIGATLIPVAPLFLVSKYSFTNNGNYAPDATKSLIDCLDLTVYTGWSASSAPDVFDPNFTAFVNNWTATGLTANSFYGQLETSPLVIGYTPDDSDELFGIGPGLEYPGVSGSHPHNGWMAIAAAPTKTSSPRYSWTYLSSTVYSKQHLISNLQTKYGTVAALNAAWGSTYTTFGSAGGWPKHSTGGTGLVDEDGSSTWLGDHDGTLRNAASGVATDLDAFLLEYWQKYFSVMKTARDTYLPDKLLFSPTLDGGAGVTRKQILQAAAQYFDVLAISAQTQTLLDVSASYTGDMPYVFDQLIMSANPDSSLWRYPNPNPYTYTTQTARATGVGGYVSTANFIATAKVTATGTEPMVGATYWALADSWAEKANWGLVTFLDNAYDGLEAVTTAGADSWGFPTGCLAGLACEERSYGAFIPPVQSANLNILRTVASGK
jgi:hypothetical protein